MICFATRNLSRTRRNALSVTSTSACAPDEQFAVRGRTTVYERSDRRAVIDRQYRSYRSIPPKEARASPRSRRTRSRTKTDSSFSYSPAIGTTFPRIDRLFATAPPLRLRCFSRRKETGTADRPISPIHSSSVTLRALERFEAVTLFLQQQFFLDHSFFSSFPPSRLVPFVSLFFFFFMLFFCPPSFSLAFLVACPRLSSPHVLPYKYTSICLSNGTASQSNRN